MLAELARKISWPSLLHALSGVVDNIVFSSFSEIPGRRANWHADHRGGKNDLPKSHSNLHLGLK
jgi:hypothetical protein